jgi:protein TonB
VAPHPQKLIIALTLLCLGFVDPLGAAAPARVETPVDRAHSVTAYSGFTRIRDALARAFAAPEAAEWYHRTPLGGPVSEDDFNAAIVSAGQRGDVEEMLRLAVQAAVVCPVDDGFPVRFARIIECLQVTERVTGKAVPDAIAQPVFAAAMTMPRDHILYQSGQIVRATHCGNRADFEAERRITEGLLAEPSLMEQVRPSALSLLGSALENLGRPAEAAAVYTRLYALEPGESYCRLAIRAVFLNLHAGRVAEADRLLGELQQLPASSLNLTEGGDQIESMLRLRRAGRAKDYWQRWPTWWPEWRSLASAAGLPSEGVETVTPLLGSESALAYPPRSSLPPGSARQLLQQLRRFVSAARWCPDAAAAVAASSDDVSRIAPGLSVAYDHLAISILEHARDEFTGTENHRERQVQLANLYAITGRYDPAFAIIRTLREDGEVSLDLRGRVDQIWIYAALMAREGVADAAAALRADLREDVTFTDRAAAVALAADAYDWLGAREAEKELLTRELNNPDVKRDSSAWARLATHLEVARGRDGEPTSDQAGFSSLEVPPKTVHKVAAVYPAALQRAGIRGTVLLEFVVDESGAVISVRVVSSPNSMLSDLAVAAVAKWQFEPGKRDGQPVAMRMHVPLSFGPEATAVSVVP